MQEILYLCVNVKLKNDFVFVMINYET